MATNRASALCGSILGALSRRAKYMRNLVVVLLVWGAQEAATDLFFHCPCYEVTPGSDIPHRRISYSVMWIFVPTMILWLTSILMLDLTWRCVTGCRNRPRPHPDQGCACCWKVLGESALAPMTWLFLVFLDGTFMECAQAYVPSACLDAANPPPQLQDIQLRNTDARWTSAIIGLSLALSLVLIYMLAALCSQCSSGMSYYQSRYQTHILQLEQDALDDAAREENYPVLKARWKALFHTGTDADWTDASSLPLTTPVKKKAGYVYSQFQGMRFSGEHVYMESDFLPPYRHQHRPEVVVVQDERPSHSHVTSREKSLPAITNKAGDHKQSGQDARRKKKKVSTPVVQITSPPQSDDESAA